MKLVGKHHFWHFSRDIDAESNMKNRSKRMQTLPRSLCPLHDKQRGREKEQATEEINVIGLCCRERKWGGKKPAVEEEPIFISHRLKTAISTFFCPERSFFLYVLYFLIFPVILCLQCLHSVAEQEMAWHFHAAVRSPRGDDGWVYNAWRFTLCLLN